MYSILYTVPGQHEAMYRGLGIRVVDDHKVVVVVDDLIGRKFLGMLDVWLEDTSVEIVWS